MDGSSASDASASGSSEGGSEAAATQAEAAAALPPGFTSVTVRVSLGEGAGARLSPAISWEEAQLAISVEHFAAVAKPVIGYPSFFAAPLFRRIKATFPPPTLTAPAVWGEEAAQLAKEAQAAAVYSAALLGEGGGGAAAAAAAPRAGSAGRGGKPAAASAPPSSALAGLSLAGSALNKKPLPPAPTAPLPSAATKCVTVPGRCVDAARDGALCERLKGERDSSGSISLLQLMAWWLAEVEPYDATERFFRLVKSPAASAMAPGDLTPFMEELLSFHPGLEFLGSTPEFQEKYTRTVIARAFFEWDPAGRSAITLPMLRRSNLVAAFLEVDVQEDINQVNEYFSYEHFYVLYCKFWELDSDHDYLLSREDLSRLAHVTPLALDRAFAQAGKPFVAGGGGRRAHDGLRGLYLLLHGAGGQDHALLPQVRIPPRLFNPHCCPLASLTPLHARARTHAHTPHCTWHRYWFNVCDLDGDGVLTSQDIFPFYREQMARMVAQGQEAIKFEDVLCQFADLLHPARAGHFRIEDFLNPERIKLTGCFFNSLFDLNKFNRFEAREAKLVKQGDNYDASHSQWNCYVRAGAGGGSARLAPSLFPLTRLSSLAPSAAHAHATPFLSKRTGAGGVHAPGSRGQQSKSGGGVSNLLLV